MVLGQFHFNSSEALIGLTVAFTILEWLILVSARRLGIGARVEPRSLHHVFTPVGGGLLWVIVACLAVALIGPANTESTFIFLGGVLVLGSISLADDIHKLPPVPRLLVQIVVVGITFHKLCTPHTLNLYLLLMFCGVGIINALNFLDGIRGMLAFYSIIVVASLYYQASMVSAVSDGPLMTILPMILIALIVFAVFNIRDAIFAGDVGAISMGYIVVYAMYTLILATNDSSIIIFVGVCLFDIGLTLLQRLFAGENILLAHRKNIYQTLTLERGIPQIVVSLIYALLQLLIDALYFLIPAEQHWTYVLVVGTLLTITYFAVRFSPNPANNENQ